MPARSAGQLQAAYGIVIDSLVPGMGADNILDREPSQRTFEQIALRTTRPGAERERVAFCNATVVRLGDWTPKPARIWLLRQLARCGGPESVGTLAGLLVDADPDIRETARRALQTNPSPSAAVALRRALDQTRLPEWRVALINALAARHDAGSRGAFARFASDPETSLSAAAIAALAELGDPRSVAALTDLVRDLDSRRREAALTALLRCADRWSHDGRSAPAARLFEEIAETYAAASIHLAAICGLAATRREAALPILLQVMRDDDEFLAISAAAIATEIPGDRVTQRIADALPSTPPVIQARLLEGLAARGGEAARRAASDALASRDPEVRAAAARALGRLGDRSSVLPLARLAAESTGTEREAARAGLARVPGDDVDAAIITAVGSSAPEVRAELVRSVGARYNRAGLPTVFKAAS
ncbi:MAG TPA: HEAT repeat domain-containing protein, partial [Phycisphaerae bacterium]